MLHPLVRTGLGSALRSTLVPFQSTARLHFGIAARRTERLVARAAPLVRAYSIPASSPAAETSAPASPPVISRVFWQCKHTWRRAALNTFRCLVGCSIGDLSMMYYLMTTHPDVSMSAQMALSMTAGISTSILLETTLLHLGKDRLPWGIAARTALGMSLVSMLAMEFTENLVTLGLADASMSLSDPSYWLITALSMAAGFVAPLPYNYLRLKRYGKACH